jgi:hypothetical protein
MLIVRAIWRLEFSGSARCKYESMAGLFDEVFIRPWAALLEDLEAFGGEEVPGNVPNRCWRGWRTA